jgi:DNA-directed RNA polymerase subunit RPC12/RpoP
MNDKYMYKCNTCGEEKELTDSKHQSPECCGKPMAKVVDLPPCVTSNTAEHARLDDLEGPCDDGRSGKI